MKTFEPKISVIIPVYNSENYLEECLNSCLLQTYENIEVICIDDGSSDRSAEILKSYLKKDRRIKVFEQENKGVSSARNKGILNAKGDYISFLDSDDWISLCLFERFKNALYDVSKEVDMYVFNMNLFYEEPKENIETGNFLSIKNWQNRKDENTIHTIKDCKNPFRGNLSACNKIYKKSFLKENKILMPEGLIFEDHIFAIESLIRAKSVLVTNEMLYMYRNSNQNSITKNYGRKIFDIFKITENLQELFIKYQDWEIYKYAVLQHRYRQYAYLYFTADEKYKKEFYQKAKNILREIIETDYETKILERLNDYYILKDIIELGEEEFFKKHNSKYRRK